MTEALLDGFRLADVDLAPDCRRLLWRRPAGPGLDAAFYRWGLEEGGEERLTEVERLFDLARARPAPRLAGLVLHVSRCGSTLVVRALQAAGALVLSEPAPLLKALWLPLETPDGPDRPARLAVQAALLRALVAVLAAPRSLADQPVVVKLSHWNAAQVGFLTRVWPGVPWLFLHRDPLEVLVANLRRGPELDPARLALLLGAGQEGIATLGPEERLAALLGALCASARASAQAGGRSAFLDHADLDADALGRIVRFFGLEAPPTLRPALEALARSDAKDRDGARPFLPDGEAKRAEATAAMRQAVDRFARPPYLGALALSRTHGSGLGAVAAGRRR